VKKKVKVVRPFGALWRPEIAIDLPTGPRPAMIGNVIHHDAIPKEQVLYRIASLFLCSRNE
jgi:hypothetical protein